MGDDEVVVLVVRVDAVFVVFVDNSELLLAMRFVSIGFNLFDFGLSFCLSNVDKLSSESTFSIEPFFFKLS